MSAAGPAQFFETQLASIFSELKEINTKLALLQRADDVSNAERKNLEYRVTEAEKAIHALENAPQQQRQQIFQGWGLGLSGCGTLIMAASACISLVGVLSGVAGLIVALVR